MTVISEVIRKTDFLGGGVLWDNVKYPRPVLLPNSFPSLALIVMHLFLLTPAYLCLSFHITTLLSFHQYVMIQEPRTESEQEHTVASQAQSGGPLLLHAEVVTGTSSITIVPLPETAWQSLVLLPLLQCLNIPVG